MGKETLISRREFISILASIAAIHPTSSLAEDLLKQAAPVNEPWLTLSAVQQHLFPKDTSLGALDIQALDYLRLATDTPDFDKDEKKLIHNGVGWLNDLSKQTYSKKFTQLENQEKEKILRRIEGSRAGERWLSKILTYLLEALLTDPIYGGNPDGIVWKWLQHQPGFPRPTKNKKYYQLDPKRFRTTKA